MIFFVRKDRRAILSAIAAGLVTASGLMAKAGAQGGKAVKSDPATLFEFANPDIEGRTRFERVVANRRSIRDFRGGPMTSVELGQLLWAAQGISDPAGLRTAPSAGALFPLELYAIFQGSDDLEPGVYHYLPSRHGIEQVKKGDFRADFAAAAVGQQWTARAGVILVVAAVYSRMANKYGERSRRYVAIEAGHCAQNVYLQSVALGLGATEVGAFRDGSVSRLVALPRNEEPVTCMVVGKPA